MQPMGTITNFPILFQTQSMSPNSTMNYLLEPYIIYRFVENYMGPAVRYFCSRLLDDFHLPLPFLIWHGAAARRRGG